MVVRKNASAIAAGGIEKKTQSVPEPHPDFGAGTAGKAQEPHPAGDVKHGLLVQLLRLMMFTTWFNMVVVCIHVTQIIGAPLYWIDRENYYAYMALTKRSFGILSTTITQWFSPTLVRVSWHESMHGQLRKTPEGNLETTFPERLVLMANHQIYTDWLYLWWIAYANHMHGYIYIILKEQLKYIPFLGPGMMFYGFIFMARKWASDKARLAYRLGKLKLMHTDPRSGSAEYDPMWLMIFPEGTNLSANTRKGSVKWASKQDIPDMRHALLPRSTGLQFCLSQLDGTVEWVYDCTMAYEGVPEGGYAQDYFTLRSTYFQGRPPKSVNMYWRRYAVSEIPLHDHEAFDAWLTTRWREKDELLDQYLKTGRFPTDQTQTTENSGTEDGYINTEVKLRSVSEVFQIFQVLATVYMILSVMGRLWNMRTSSIFQMWWGYFDPRVNSKRS